MQGTVLGDVGDLERQRGCSAAALAALGARPCETRDPVSRCRGLSRLGRALAAAGVAPPALARLADAEALASQVGAGAESELDRELADVLEGPGQAAGDGEEGAAE